MSAAKTAAVGKQESVALFRAAGIYTVAAQTPQQAGQAVRQLAENGCQVIFLGESFGEPLAQLCQEYRSQPYPVILPIPEQGSSGYGKKAARANLEKAIGAGLADETEEGGAG